MEPYIFSVKCHKARRAIAKLRTSFHALLIDHGRHLKPKLPREKRLCHVCNELDDEQHFIMTCHIHAAERARLFQRFTSHYHPFDSMCEIDKFKYIFSTNDTELLTCLGKFIEYAFKKRQMRTLSYINIINYVSNESQLHFRFNSPLNIHPLLPQPSVCIFSETGHSHAFRSIIYDFNYILELFLLFAVSTVSIVTLVYQAIIYKSYILYYIHIFSFKSWRMSLWLVYIKQGI